MEGKMSSDRYFKEAFGSFEQDPPPASWERLKTHLEKTSVTAESVYGYRNFRYRIFPVLAAGAVILLALYLWLGLGRSGSIKGSVSMEDQSLSRGTVILLQLHDITRPFDSVQYVTSAAVDSAGRFEFANIPYGKYLIRVHSDTVHNYFGDGLTWNQADVIHWQGEDTCFGIQLNRKPTP